MMCVHVQFMLHKSIQNFKTVLDKLTLTIFHYGFITSRFLQTRYEAH